MSEIDESFWSVMKRKSFSKYNLFLLRRDLLYFVVVTDKEKAVMTYSSFGKEYARKKYNEWKNHIMVNDSLFLSELSLV